MVLLRDLKRVGRRFPRPYLTLGSFDGVHRGHQEILHRLVATAREAGGTSMVLTFHPHPAAVLSPAGPPPLITPLRARLELLVASGVDVVILQRFSSAFAAIEGETFITDILHRDLAVNGIIVGHRVSFGYRRSGSAELLQRLAAANDFSVEVVGPVDVEGELVSSSAVRAKIAAGELDGARQLLGRWPAVYGRVRRGHQRGKEMGVPTANLPVRGIALPPDGVYATWSKVRGEWVASVSNLGTNPTFGDNERGLEVHLLDRSLSIYGERLEVRLIKRLRGEMKFPDAQALVAQIGKDVVLAKSILEGAAAE